MSTRLKILFFPVLELVLLPVGCGCFESLGPHWGAAFLSVLWPVLLWSAAALLFFSIAFHLGSSLPVTKATLLSAGLGLLLAFAVALLFFSFSPESFPGLLGDLLRGTTPASLAFGLTASLCVFISVLRKGRRRRMFT